MARIVLLLHDKTVSPVMIDYAKELNDSQLEAVRYIDGPSLVIAGAGSGKTRVLTYKISYLLDHGYVPSSILALTFTNKAAEEMKSRIAAGVGEERARYLWMGTFHSIFARILRRESAALGFSQDYTIYDQSDSRSLLRAIVREMGLDEKVYKPATVQGRISEAKNNLITATMYYNDGDYTADDNRRRMPAMRDIYRSYADRLRRSDAMDFDDLLLNTYYLFKNNADILEHWQQRFAFVLVDEYQDTNRAQHEIVWQLTCGHRKVCVVGDDSQSIYSFRGARIDNILGFQRRYEGARLFKLEQNYRSTKTIVKAANSLIEHNANRIPKEVFSQREVGDAITVFDAQADKEEAAWVVRRIQSLKRTYGLDNDDFAILYRTNAQSRPFEEELRRNDIEYRIYGGLSFYQRKEIKDIIAYFRVIVNPHDEEALKRIINYPARGIGDTTLQHLMEAASAADTSLWNVICMPELHHVDINKGILTRLAGFRTLIEGFRAMTAEQDAYTLGRAVIDQSGIRSDIFSDMSDEGRSRQENVQELLGGMQDFVQTAIEEGNEALLLRDWLAGVALLTDQDNPHDHDTPRVTLMTVHAAKGLEFDTVFVVGLEEELFPSSMAETPFAIEEERRLFYVAITRAEQRCFLTWVKMRFRYGQMQWGQRSRFVKELDCSCVCAAGESPSRRPDAAVHLTRLQKSNTPARQTFSSKDMYPSRTSTNSPSKVTSPAPSSSASTAPRRLVSMDNLVNSSSSSTGVPLKAATRVAALEPGQRIEHERFGKGTVVRVEGSDDNRKATIAFDNVGEKTLLLKFARFRVL